MHKIQRLCYLENKRIPKHPMLKNVFLKVEATGNLIQSPFLLLIRLYWGYQFAITGLGKLTHIQDIVSYFQSLHIPLPHANVIFVGTVELCCGTLLFLGLFSRIAAIPLFGVMCVAYLTAEQESVINLITTLDPDLFFSRTPFLFAYAVLIIFCFGPGKLSLDYYLRGFQKKKEMP